MGEGSASVLLWSCQKSLADVLAARSPESQPMPRAVDNPASVSPSWPSSTGVRERKSGEKRRAEALQKRDPAGMATC